MADSRPPSADGADDPDEADVRAADTDEEFRQEVAERYDFDSFGPSDMARMSEAEWEAAFDAETWITGEGLLRRVEADLRSRIADRDVFARLERVDDGLLAYSDEGYAVVHPDGSVEGRGTVLRDVKPTVALCSMHDYDIPTPPPDGELLPDPDDVPEGTGELGNRMLQVVAAAQFLTGVGLVLAWVVVPVETIFAPVAGIIFVGLSLLLFLQVANARLSDRFRSEEYRNRLRAIGSDDRPEFLPARYREPPSAADGDRDGNEDGESDRPAGADDPRTDPASHAEETDDSVPSA
ncbi:hypothetical protein [Halococcus sp. IIIV-5B]|uniref:DUF7319 domain-containing protein n=1 Tax=Halococcus sp. IIIV-5B TaxID=2321230 RepID=UPI000E7636C9|nr:hypothetical protein [Halococcus sp. IIIV-5B]RJT06722.1 hypothetical protein D3261_04210 [Halococcus sp. IIIV-5B]